MMIIYNKHYENDDKKVFKPNKYYNVMRFLLVIVFILLNHSDA